MEARYSTALSAMGAHEVYWLCKELIISFKDVRARDLPHSAVSSIKRVCNKVLHTFDPFALHPEEHFSRNSIWTFKETSRFDRGLRGCEAWNPLFVGIRRIHRRMSVVH